jgi:predicted GH43/DUF377 family glycosyl hydrolase
MGWRCRLANWDMRLFFRGDSMGLMSFSVVAGRFVEFNGSIEVRGGDIDVLVEVVAGFDGCGDGGCCDGMSSFAVGVEDSGLGRTSTMKLVFVPILHFAAGDGVNEDCCD